MFLKLLKRALPLPDLREGETYLFVGAHPDDIEVGAGGTVAKLVDLKKKVYFVIITDGGCGSMDASIERDRLVKTRREEALNAAKELKVEDVSFLGFPDAGDYREYDVAKALAPIILRINPDFVFAPDPNLPSEIHPDHLKAGNAVKMAMLFSGYPLVYRDNVGAIPQTSEKAFRFRNLCFFFTHRANAFMSLDQVCVHARKHAIMCHESQFPNDEELKQILKYLSIRSRIFGALGKREREGFFALGPVHQHCFSEVNRY
ncbi:MAG: PIG-L family deacetylase [Candidatus Izemoplasmatales bacterium]|jgi:LmbE family N-acetylglucosaminyl deacetylase